jgi:hypothetical protein
MKLDMSLTPQEMAKALTNEMGAHTIDRNCYHCTDEHDNTGEMLRHRGRKCALVAVELQIEAARDVRRFTMTDRLENYWLQVKQIIENEQEA